MRKALTSRGTRLPPASLPRTSSKTPNAGGLRLGNMIPARGALPIKASEETIGAVGVSGAPGGDKDEAWRAGRHRQGRRSAQIGVFGRQFLRHCGELAASHAFAGPLRAPRYL